ncbi:MAG: response regulator [Chloroflexi bacterium]|nr:MAG: response regulator [Chloroflexota bacterium]
MKRVLIAEDDPDTAAAMKVTLEDRLSVTTDIVTNGALVLDQITARHPDLLILDVSLPGLNGVDVFDLVRGNARCGEVPVLFVTAAPDRAREAFAHCGISDVMAKPFDVDELAARVMDLLALTVAAA